MRLTVLGCAGSFPGPESACSAYLVEAEGFRLLMQENVGAEDDFREKVTAGKDQAAINFDLGATWTEGSRKSGQQVRVAPARLNPTRRLRAPRRRKPTRARQPATPSGRPFS